MANLIRLGCILAGLWVTGCAVSPAPIVIYEDDQQSVWLQFDPHAGAGHSHPASLTPEQLAAVLGGLRVKGRDVVGGFGLFSEKESAPTFSAAQILKVAPYLSQALKKASPQDMATFYLMAYDINRSPVITSGGVFVRNTHLYVILANARTSPGSIQYETTYEPNTRDQPLLPIARFKFTAGFSPKEAWVPTEEAKRADSYPGYVDESKLIVIDLPRLFAQSGAPAAAPRLQP